jgi:acetyltransferase-like isoleucine patch superfamily enzyme
MRTVMIGSGGHARVLADILRLRGGLELVAVLDDDPRTHGGHLGSVEIIGSTALLERRPRAATACVAAVGDNHARARIFNLALGLGYHLPPLVHPSAVIARDVSIPDGTIICAGCVIEPGVSLRADCFLSANAVLEVECALGGHCLVGAGAVLRSGSHLVSYTVVSPGSLVESDRGEG